MRFESKKIKESHRKYLIGVVVLVLSMFFGAIFLSRLNSKHYSRIEFQSEFYLNVTSIKKYKGSLSLNDSVAISGNYPVILSNINYIKKNHIFSDEMVPYELFKKMNNDTLLLVKNSDSLYFKLVYSDF